MSEMIERVARAAHDAQWEEPFPTEGSISYAVAIRVARAAIKAMREPSREMVDAAINNGDYGDPGEFHPAITTVGYQAMIDEALK